MWKRIIIIVALIVLILVVVFVNKSINTTVVDTSLPQTEENSLLETLVVKHQYKDGEHVFIGDIDLPTPCYSYNAFIQDTEDPNKKILKVETKDSGEVCAEVITTATFRVSYKGAEDLTFTAFVNDKEYRLNSFEIPKTVDIDEFEIFIKG